ncbi:hypothetical protein BEL04_17600 [Mucilaginibacter sp. PPCGB 2223]|nr:hypothetical protein BEL04_17600 [Mucilaginibacter sp. PPCGB 2223]
MISEKRLKVYKWTALCFLIFESLTLLLWIYVNFDFLKTVAEPADKTSAFTPFREFLLPVIEIGIYNGFFLIVTFNIVRKMMRSKPIKYLKAKLILIFIFMILPAIGVLYLSKVLH